MRTSLSYRREVADKMLTYFKAHSVATCPNTYNMLCQVSEGIGEPLHILWRSYELLRTMARLELNNPNGRKGFKVLDYTPLSLALPDRPNVPVCEARRCPILKAIVKQFPNITIYDIYGGG